jgi:hypothetical protein
MSCESAPHHASSNLKFRQASGWQRLISNSPLARPGCLALETGSVATLELRRSLAIASAKLDRHRAEQTKNEAME